MSTKTALYNLRHSFKGKDLGTKTRWSVIFNQVNLSFLAFSLSWLPRSHFFSTILSFFPYIHFEQTRIERESFWRRIQIGNVLCRSLLSSGVHKNVSPARVLSYYWHSLRLSLQKSRITHFTASGASISSSSSFGPHRC